MVAYKQIKCMLQKLLQTLFNLIRFVLTILYDIIKETVTCMPRNGNIGLSH